MSIEKKLSALLATLLIPERRERTCPRAVKRARHNSYPVKKPGQAASIRHSGPATIRFWPIKPPPLAHATDLAAPPPTGHHKNVLKGQKRAPGPHARPPVKRHQPGPVPPPPPPPHPPPGPDPQNPQKHTTTPRSA